MDFHSDKYKMNIQNERRDKVLKLPFKIEQKNEKIRVRTTDPGDLFVEDHPHAKVNQNGLKWAWVSQHIFLQTIKTN